MADVELTASQAKELTAAEAAVNELRQVLLRAQRAGLDTSDLQRKLEDADSKRAGMLREFLAGAASRRNRS